MHCNTLAPQQTLLTKGTSAEPRSCTNLKTDHLSAERSKLKMFRFLPIVKLSTEGVVTGNNMTLEGFLYSRFHFCLKLLFNFNCQNCRV